jgi:hypothetical protein
LEAGSVLPSSTFRNLTLWNPQVGFTPWLGSASTCKTLPWRFMCATTCSLHDITKCMKKSLKSPNQVKLFMKKWPISLFLTTHLAMEIVKPGRKENKKNQPIGQSHLFCFIWNIVFMFFVPFIDIFHLPTHTCGGAIFHE